MRFHGEQIDFGLSISLLRCFSWESNPSNLTHVSFRVSGLKLLSEISRWILIPFFLNDLSCSIYSLYSSIILWQLLTHFLWGILKHNGMLLWDVPLLFMLSSLNSSIWKQEHSSGSMLCTCGHRMSAKMLIISLCWHVETYVYSCHICK